MEPCAIFASTIVIVARSTVSGAYGVVSSALNKSPTAQTTYVTPIMPIVRSVDVTAVDWSVIVIVVIIIIGAIKIMRVIKAEVVVIMRIVPIGKSRIIEAGRAKPNMEMRLRFCGRWTHQSEPSQSDGNCSSRKKLHKHGDKPSVVALEAYTIHSFSRLIWH
jgi:hypothetical protein